MKRIFRIESGMDLKIRLSIDTDVITPDLARDISQFWASKNEVLKVSDGDEYQAVARYAAVWLWHYLIDGYTDAGAVEELHEQEGWCITGATLGIEIIDADVPSMDQEYLEVEEVTS